MVNFKKGDIEKGKEYTLSLIEINWNITNNHFKRLYHSSRIKDEINTKITQQKKPEISNSRHKNVQ